ncbi:phage/plasmid primase, P4 family, partial [Enterobacter sp. 56-7]|uniref:DNA primase family protein n=1 Tax=Enterobacter sp. 56-7 TaxID=1895906 RepID=UPI000AC2B52B
QLWPGDSESQETLQEIFGYLLTPDTSQHKIFLIVGPRRSGKGTMGRVAGELLGGDNVVSPQLSSLLTQFGMEPLIGKLLALLSDARIGGQTNVQALVERLLMISGEDSITIDRKFRQAWSGTLGARFLFMSNEVPQLGDASNALSGRFIILSLRESFYGREDPSLTQRLLLELPGIFKWALDGKERLAKRGHFLQPAGGLDDVEELVAMGSPISVFLMDCCELDASYHVPIQKLYSEWLKWNYTHGRANPGTAQTFGKLLRAAQPRIRRSYPMLQGERERYYEGIRLKVEPGNEFL